MHSFVPAEGPTKCVMAIVGEAPGVTEELEGRPFCGQSGNVLNTKLHNIGLARQECYITNLVKVRPPNNDFGIYWNGHSPSAQLLSARDDLLQELDKIDTNVIVPLGANALWALTGKTQIGKWRGSLLSCNLPSGRVVKVIPSYHPAAVLRQWEFGVALEIDLRKAFRESKTQEIILPSRNLLIQPTYSDVLSYLRLCADSQEFAYDIETYPGGISCIAFSHDPSHALCVPTTREYWKRDLKPVLEQIEALLTHPGPTKIGQNIAYELQYLSRFYGVLVEKPWCDTMIMQHSCYSELPKSLAFLASIYTNEPYYKDDFKVWTNNKADLHTLWTYNAKDAAVTLEVKRALDKEMDELAVRHTYEYMMELLEPLLYMMLRGVKIDEARRAHHEREYTDRIEMLEKQFQEKYGNINPRSHKQMLDLAYNKLNLKPIIKNGKPTVNKQALNKLSIHSPSIKLAADIRSEKTNLANFVRIKVDAVDKRLKCTFNSTGAATRRLSSSESVFGSGRNLQNFPKKLRDIIVADEGKMLTEADLSGAESRVVAYMSEDPFAISLFESNKNIHTYTACQIWGMTPEQVEEDKHKKEEMGEDTKSKYFIAKKLRHSIEKRGSWVTVSEQLRISAKEAKLLVQRFYDNNPNLLKWFREVEDKLRKDRTIITPLGDKRIFFGRFGPQMVSEAVAHIAQETVGRIINTGIINIYKTLCPNSDVEVLLQVHDAVLLQHNIENKDYIHSVLPSLMRVEVPWKGGYFVIPVDLKSGLDWRNMQ